VQRGWFAPGAAPLRSLPATASRTLKAGCVRPDFAKKGEKEVEAAFDQGVSALRDAVIISAGDTSRFSFGARRSDPVGGMSTLCGLPAISVPCGFGRGGLPVGLTIVAGAFEEGKILALAKLYQSVTDRHRRHPPIA
jgi:Asp-tRNA(Asn)/Glu-tRNA(Gln) amidotransferase A subunit family amidase